MKDSKEYLKTILITGAAGTWGREFTKQLLEKGHGVIALDRDEKSIAEYRRMFPEVKVLMQDYVNVDFSDVSVDLLIHLAAYKHIDLCEHNIAETIENNIDKTITLYKNAREYDVEILYVSTDKAVEPVSVYGMSKAISERLTWEFGGSVIRSGNIIGSNGSVTEIWREAVKNNKPLNVTDLGMKRYFITAPEAVELAWKGYLTGKRLILVTKGGQVELSEIINKILGEFGHTIGSYEPGINITGMRPGERLVDEISWVYDEKYLK
jgi:UDP-N-acetylglucosamine 4,6-dehydratase/5-epimerase